MYHLCCSLNPPTASHQVQRPFFRAHFLLPLRHLILSCSFSFSCVFSTFSSLVCTFPSSPHHSVLPWLITCMKTFLKILFSDQFYPLGGLLYSKGFVYNTSIYFPSAWPDISTQISLAQAERSQV